MGCYFLKEFSEMICEATQLAFDFFRPMEPLQLSPAELTIRDDFAQRAAIKCIKREVCKYFAVPQEIAHARRPTRYQRQIKRLIVFFVWGLTRFNLSEITWLLGMGSVSTVRKLIVEAEELLQVDPGFRRIFLKIRESIFEQHNGAIC